MGVRIRNQTISHPTLLLAGVLAVLSVTVLVAMSTSATAFGFYNADWDGASGLRNTANAAGAESTIVLNTSTYDSTAANQSVSIVLSPDEPYTDSEQERLEEYVRRGGTIVIAEDFGSQGNRLLRGVGASARFDGALLRDERNYYRSPAFPIATNISTSPRTDGVSQLTLNYGTTIRNETIGNSTVLARSSEFAYLDRNRNDALDTNESLERRPIVVQERVGSGSVIAVSDPSLFINTMLERPGNRAFVSLLFADHKRVLLDYSHHSGRPPLIVGLLILQDTPLLQALVGIGGIVAVFAVSEARNRRHLINQWVSGSEATEDPTPVDNDALRVWLFNQHPDWDADRVTRITAGILSRDSHNDDNE